MSKIIFAFNEEEKCLVAYVTPEDYWDIREVYMRDPIDVELNETSKGVLPMLMVIGAKGREVQEAHGPVKIRIETVHMGPKAHERLIPE